MRKDGGPAFPTDYRTGERQGMTLRDYFAAKAMIGLVSTTGLWSHDEDDTGIASGAYAIADAMLAERAK